MSAGKKADLPEDEIVRLSEEGLSLRAIASRYGVSVQPIRRVLREAGRPGGRRRWTEERALEALRAYAEEAGRQPSLDRWRRERRVPVARVYAELFGSWANAMAAAGFDALIPGDGRPFAERAEFDRESEGLQARVDAGETLAAIALDLGVAPQSLGRRLRRWRSFYGGEHRLPAPGPRPKR